MKLKKYLKKTMKKIKVNKFINTTRKVKKKARRPI